MIQKPNFWSRAFVITTWIGACVYFQTLAQPTKKDAKAFAILEAVNQKYKSFTSFQADFTYKLYSPTSKVNETVAGNITVKGKKYALKLEKQEIRTDGKTIWTYLKDANEVTIADYEKDDDEITPENIFEIYKKGFKYIYTGETKEGGVVYDNIELAPEDRNKKFTKIKIKIDQAQKTIKSWEIYMRNADRYSYVVNNFVSNPIVNDNIFIMNKSQFPKAEWNDLR
ncbi:MAG: outer membrane lipoprotein carrier protein LolA [Microscillaceae bacterium]|nr:outer membrane lipoprotein carrier protein LolA [Microscillaceae bacterium]MDW8460107.1 outer membrane lipoprotein carrier protein LolA [Cytophagales bacterium]